MSGNQDSFDRIYRAYYRALLKVVSYKISCPEIAEDVLQDAFIKIWIALPNYNLNKGGIYTWMATICTHEAIDHLKSRSYRKTTITDELQPELRNLGGRQICLTRTDEMDVLFQVSLLRKTYAEPLQLYSTGYTHTEIGNMLDIPLGTVKTRIRTGFMILRRVWAYDASMCNCITVC